MAGGMIRDLERRGGGPVPLHPDRRRLGGELGKMFHAAGELCRCVLFGLPLEECWIILEHERARRATGHDRLVRRQGGKVIAGAFGDEAGMPVGLDRGPRAALRRERRVDPLRSEERRVGEEGRSRWAAYY